MRAVAQMVINVAPGAEQVTMSMPGFVDSHASCMLFDSGATHDYIASAFVAKCGIQRYSDEERVSCAGGTSVLVTNYVLAQVQLQALSEIVKMYAVDMRTPNVHVILGQAWLKAHKALISHATKFVMFWQGNRRAELKCVCGDPDLAPLPNLPFGSMNFVEFQAEGLSVFCGECRCTERKSYVKRGTRTAA